MISPTQAPQQQHTQRYWWQCESGGCLATRNTRHPFPGVTSVGPFIRNRILPHGLGKRDLSAPCPACGTGVMRLTYLNVRSFSTGQAARFAQFFRV
jgi:hypothetical protein